MHCVPIVFWSSLIPAAVLEVQTKVVDHHSEVEGSRQHALQSDLLNLALTASQARL